MHNMQCNVRLTANMIKNRLKNKYLLSIRIPQETLNKGWSTIACVNNCIKVLVNY